MILIWSFLFSLRRRRRHPSARLSSHKLGRPFGLANPGGFEVVPFGRANSSIAID